MTPGYRIVARQPGGPDQIERVALDRLACGAGEVLVRTTAIGVNFIDTYHRSGLYPMPAPVALGMEAAGVVEAVGAGVEGVAPGDRVAVLADSPGTYATALVVRPERLVKLPDAVTDDVGAAALLKGLTAWMLAEPCGKVAAGQTVLVHSAAGGVGMLLVQWLKALGARVIAHAGNSDKADRARALGADEALSGPFDGLAADVRALTDGEGVSAVFDGVGAASWAASMAATARCGLVVTYGNASGPVPPFSPLELNRAGSLFVTRPKLYDYIAEPGALQAAAARLFGLIADGTLTVDIGQRFPLAEAAAAHRALEARQTTGSTILIP
ncbi:MAG: NADPH:quinone reductase [Sphingomonas bacterium]|nr:NADPH:quinone reductase [Sphingomonas bacterium]